MSNPTAYEYDIEYDGEEGPVIHNSGRSLSRGVMFVVLTVLLLISILMAATAPAELSRPFIVTSVLIGTAVMVLHIVYHLTNAGKVNWLSIDVLFMLCFYFVHYSYPLLWSLGIVPGVQKIWIDESVVCLAMSYAGIGFILYVMGFLALADRETRPNWPVRFDSAVSLGWKRIGWLWSLLGFGSLFLYAVQMGGDLTSGQYQGSEIGSYGARVTHLAMEFFLRTGLVLSCLGAALHSGKLKTGLPLKVGVCVFAAWLLVLGDRSLAVMMVMFVAVVYAEYVRRISLKILIPIIIAGLFMISVVRIARHAKQRSFGNLVEVARSGGEETGLQAGLLNVGSSLRALNAAVCAVPHEYAYFGGTLKVTGVSGLVPFSRRLIPQKLEYTSSAVFLTYWIYSGNMQTGAGTTIVADLYVDWGLPGIAVGMFGLGLLSKWLQQKARSTPSITWSVVHMSAIPWMMLLPRYSITSLVRGLIWPAITVAVLSALLGLPKRVSTYEEELHDMAEDDFYDFADTRG